MGFSNEYLTEEEIELFKTTEHWAFIRKQKNETICLEKWCTVDREKKIWLMCYPHDYSYEPSLKVEKFVVFYGAIHKDNLIELCMKDLGEDKDSMAKYGVRILKYWELKEIKMPSKLNVKEEEIIKMLSDIMTAYGISGNPRHKGAAFDGKFKAIVERDSR